MDKKLRCTHCKCLVLCKNTGQLLTDCSDSLPLSENKDEKTEFTSWLKIADIFDFANVGFTKTVDANIKYLTCADCEKGPIGVQYLDKNMILVAVETLLAEDWVGEQVFAQLMMALFRWKI